MSAPVSKVDLSSSAKGGIAGNITVGAALLAGTVYIKAEVRCPSRWLTGIA
jgi:hypothetical protein